LGSKHGREADAEGEGKADHDAGEGMAEDGPEGNCHGVFSKSTGFFDILMW
jgi:hypothetical protein